MILSIIPQGLIQRFLPVLGWGRGRGGKPHGEASIVVRARDVQILCPLNPRYPYSDVTYADLLVVRVPPTNWTLICPITVVVVA